MARLKKLKKLTGKKREGGGVGGSTGARMMCLLDGFQMCCSIQTASVRAAERVSEKTKKKTRQREEEDPI